MKSVRKIGQKIERRLKEKGWVNLIIFSLTRLPGLLLVGTLCFVLRLLKPLVFIRFGSLYADKIGPLVSLPGLYLLEKDQGIQPHKSVDIFHDGYGEHHHVCNTQLLRMWRRIFAKRKQVILADKSVKWFFDFCQRNAMGSEHIIQTTKNGRDVLGLIEQAPVYLSFTTDEIAQAQSEIQAMGIAPGVPFVCLMNRDQSYLKRTFPDKDWDYQSFRNCDINNYIKTAEALTKRGYFVIRMGAVVGDTMKTDNPMIIEYAKGGFRSELLDIYLAAHCHFFIGCNSGMDAVPWFFQRPEVYVNVSEIDYLHSWLSNNVMIFKKYWLKNEKRFMTVAEMLESGAGRFHCTAEYEQLGIELVENTPEEIFDVVDEQDQRLKGTWQESDEDDGLQAIFWSHFKDSNLHGVIRSRIGAKFLRLHKELLGLSPKARSVV
jgi:putative glycosyltransferase (TIGR04372 family)